jgi:hypothetical protein
MVTGGNLEPTGPIMLRFTLLAAAAALILTGTADAASRKKPRATAERSAVAKPKPSHYGTKPVYRSNQGWPTSWSDGSFSYRGN